MNQTRRNLGYASAGSLVAAFLAASCGSGSGSEFNGDPTGASSSSGASGSSGTSSGASSGGASSSSSGTFDNGDGAVVAPDAGGDGSLNACATDRQTAKLAPLDLLVMQDTSGSMWMNASGTTSKWDTVKAALDGFMKDPASAGIGMGIQFFPLFANGVPNSCLTSAECGANGGVCFTKYCVGTNFICQSNVDCGGNGVCAPLQRCAADRQFLCGSSANCANLAPTTCNHPLVRGTCGTQALSCTAADYGKLAAPIAALPGAATAVNAALAVRVPNGPTPTHAALQGAIEAAKKHAMANPGNVVAVVMSTDGIPFTNGQCNDSVPAIQALAAAGFAGTPSVRTFVIGVLSPQDATAGAKATLDGIAASGGTTAASILGTSATTQQDFIAALQKIRGQSLPCELSLPVPEAGTPDYAKVNVVYTPSTSTIPALVPYVATKAMCDAQKGGWYYDVAPGPGAKPSKVILCPATCAQVQADPTGTVEVVQGCETRTDPSGPVK